MKYILFGALFSFLLVTPVLASTQSISFNPALSQYTKTEAQVVLSGDNISFGVWVKLTTLPSPGSTMTLFSKRTDGDHSNFQMTLINNAGNYYLVTLASNGKTGGSNLGVTAYG